MNNFDEFAELIIDKMSVLSSPRHAMDMYLRANTGSIFNDYYDNSELWTDEEASKLAGRILRQGKADDEFVRNAWR